MRPKGDTSPRTAYALGLLALAAAAASVLPQLAPNTWIFRDGRFYVNVATTITENLTLDQHRFAGSWYGGTLGWNADLDPGWSNVALGAHGEHFPKHPFIHPLLAAPVVFAFGLGATLAWNIAMFGFVLAGLYRFARDYAQPAPAALAAGLFVFGSVIVESAYDFSVDVLMLAFFAQALAALCERRGLLSGVLVGLCVIIKPTALMLLPSLALLLVERAQKRELARSLGTGAAVLGVQAALNTWMYGRPWWSGYNRTLVTVHGEPTVADHADAFGTPLDEGLVRTWSGAYGLVHTFPVLALAAPGFVWMMRRRPLTALAMALAATFSVLVFSMYAYEGHRFHWPALALLVPALAATLTLVGDAYRALRARLGPRPFGSMELSSIGLGVAIVTACALSLDRSGLGRHAGSGAWVDFLVEAGLRPGALVALNLLGVAILAALLLRITARASSQAIAVSALALPLILPVTRESLMNAHAGVLVLALAAGSADSFLAGRRRAGALLGALTLGALLLPGALEGPGVVAHLEEALDARSPARMLAPVLALGALGLLSGLARARHAKVVLALGALASLALIVSVPSPGGASVVVLAAPTALLADAFGRTCARLRAAASPRHIGFAVAAALALLLSVGAARRAMEDGATFRAASQANVTRAVVMLGEVPCDFLAWEHMSWECSHFDSGLYGMVGLALSDRPLVDGRDEGLLLVPVPAGVRERRVVFPDVPARERLLVRWAVPDGQRGDVILVVEVGDAEVLRREVPALPDGVVLEELIDTRELAGTTQRLAIIVEPGASHRGGLVAVDLLWSAAR